MRAGTTTFRRPFLLYGGQKAQLATSGMCSQHGEQKAIIPSPANHSHAVICSRRRIQRPCLLSFESSLGHNVNPTLDSLSLCFAADGFTGLRTGALALRSTDRSVWFAYFGDKPFTKLWAAP